MTQRLELSQVQANPVTVSHASLDMLDMTATRPPLGTDQLYQHELWTLNRPSGSEHHKYPRIQQFIPPRVISDGTMFTGLAHAASPCSAYDGSQLLQGIMPQCMQPYSLTQLIHDRQVRGYGREYESPAPAIYNIGGRGGLVAFND
jgi:hypothetical protein